MNEKVKKFLEEQIDLIDNDRFEDLFLNAFDDFSYDDMQNLCESLVSADIHNFTEGRETALNEIISFATEDWNNGDGGVSAMPLKEFIDAFLYNRLGLSMDYVVNYILEHKEDFKNNVEIVFPEKGLLIIQRVF